jgi:hypothetical protein
MSWEGAATSSDEVIAFFEFAQSCHSRCSPGVDSFSNVNECQNMLLGSRARLARMTDILPTICEPIVWTMWDPQHLTTSWAATAC